MQRRILKFILKQTKHHEDIGSLVFGTIAFLIIVIIGARILFSRVSLNTVAQNIEAYVRSSIQSAWSNITNTFEPRVEMLKETSGTTQNGSNITTEQARTHRTTTSDTLWRLAVKYYNDGYRWTKIYEANKRSIPDPNRLDKDIILVIPE